MGKREERLELVLLMLLLLLCVSEAVTKAQKQELREKVKEMFNHAYQSYMKYAYPADELMPLSCKGRYRGSEPSRGDIDDALGNFSLTLVDTLDSLVVLGELEEFEKAVRLVIRDVSLDQDIVVSVFETNIRMLGGLLGGHVLAKYLKLKKKALLWYQDELLEKARELGIRLLPAFNTTTGIPFPRVNLRHGINQGISRTGTERDTCTSCAGTMILEFAALTRLTGDPIFETKARRAMDILWKQRHRGSDLVGTVINIHNGDWVRRESGVGAGVDSYYEYLLKAYILLGDDTYLDRFNKHYEAIGKYVKQGPMLVDVHMHRPLTNSRNFMDALLAFWPGLQVLKGDIKPAIETHEMLYQVTQRHNFLPEAFTTDFRVHWGQHPLRPEFVESTYFIYKATGDPYYLEVGKTVLEKLEKHARVKCGYASIKDVTTSSHEDQMDSFVLSETFKYLYLLFSEREDLVLDVDDYIFTTEAHLLPLSLSLFSKNITDKEVRKVSFREDDEEEDDNHDRVCPNTNYLFPGQANYAHNVRSPLKDYVDNLCPGPKKPRRKPRLRAVEFIAGNKQQLEQLRRMGIQLVTMQDGRVQLLHTASEASSAEDAEDGMLFMQDMIELSKQQQQEVQQEPRVVQFVSTPFFGQVILNAGHAQFGLDLKGREGVKGKLAVTEPVKACSRVLNPEIIWRKIAIVERGECMFIDKARHVQAAGAIGAIILDNTEGSSSETHPLFAMSGDGKDDVMIPVVFVFSKEGQRLLEAMQDRPHLEVLLGFQAKRSEVIMKEMLQQQKKAEGETEGMKPEEPSVDNLYTEGSPGESSPEAKEDEEDSRAAQDLLSSAEKTVTAGAELSEEETAALMNKYLAKIQDHNSRSQPQTPHTKDRETLWQILDGSRDSVQIKDHLDQLATGEGSSKVSRVFKGILRLLASHTNFNQLSNLEEYKRAIGKLVEAAFSHGKQKLDIGELELINQMKLELKAFSNNEELKEEFKEKLKSDMSEGKTCDKSTPGQKDQPIDSGVNCKSYAGKDDFEEPLMPETPSGGTFTEEHSQTHTHYREHVSSSVSDADRLTPDPSHDSDTPSATGANPRTNSGSQEPQGDTSSPSSRTSNTGNSQNEARQTKYLEDQDVEEELGKVDTLIRDVFVDSVEVENEDKMSTQEDGEL